MIEEKVQSFDSESLAASIKETLNLEEIDKEIFEVEKNHPKFDEFLSIIREKFELRDSTKKIQGKLFKLYLIQQTLSPNL